MDQGQTLSVLLDSYAVDPQRKAVAAAVGAIAAGSIEISELIGQGALAGITGAAHGGSNADGDVQKDLDVKAEEIIVKALKDVPYAALASEESDTLLDGDPSAPISIAYDPLDGSSNIDTNMTVGTIFSIIPNQPGVKPFTAPGSCQIAAGFVVYGPQTSLVLTLGKGVDIFTLDRKAKVYRLIRQRVTVPADTAEYAINASNHRHWEQPIRDFVDECIAGADGPRAKDFNMRWIGSLVAEVYRILTRGGVFLYPGDNRPGYGNGRLRLLYETHPMSFVMEQAGGAASTGRERVLDLTAKTIHQRSPLIMGSIDKVKRIELLHTDPSAASRSAPLFARRGLFRV
ncbi:class 1 fructose-bisphosphatase [Rhodopseudomonas sp. G2_2311]|uniref:class 1 fructose-bisphosphatase n=1 Tax=Rhodopseudomonas sp. G2_2311 TaxID=3114287 RepID=UPI0039C70730